ncbi:MAG: 3-hydroxy-3-methylglutaryl-CoA lyase [Lachnospiraceae bacterium]|nr:3-hydroxy-3-methylglutaryl-CoA lyase [Lachnospiraceae bacterium]
MNDIQLLDCTLRDGGYVNDWNFGHDNLVSIFERLVDANVDIIEIGFLDERRPFDINRSIMPDTDSVVRIYGKLDRKQAMVVGMIDYGTCSMEHIRPCSESFLDGIRVIFKKHLREPAFAFCKGLKEKGYKVFAQLVSVTSYDDEEMMDVVRLANEVKPYAVSMVDTYGLMHQNNLLHYFHLLDAHLDAEIGLGYHAHNNFQMGYANCIAMLSNRIDRLMIVDGSIYGMGKSAGNVPIELVAMHMNNALGKHYHISQILEAIDANISQFYHPATWGYNMFYYIAAFNDCHPEYVSYLMHKRTLSIKSMNEILGKLRGEEKLLYDKSVIEALYVEYQKKDVNDADDKARLGKELSGRKILLIGPGVTVKTQRERIRGFIKDNSPTVISINYVPEEFAPDYIFLSNSKRYVQLATRLSQEKFALIATSNLTGTREAAFDYVLNFSSLMDSEAEIVDNSLVMLLKALVGLGCRKVTLAGFDGYSSEASNYYNSNMEYDFAKNMAEYLNQYTNAFLKEVRDRLQVTFLTDSRYEG